MYTRDISVLYHSPNFVDISMSHWKIHMCWPLVLSLFLHPRWPTINSKWFLTAHSAALLCNVYVLSEHIKVILENFQVSCVTVHESRVCERALGREWVTHPNAPSPLHWLSNNSPLSHCVMTHSRNTQRTIIHSLPRNYTVC